MIIGKTFKFEAAHHLPGHEKCGRVHGHTYKLTVEVEGDLDPKTGMVMDLHELSRIVQDIIFFMDHQDLNTIFPRPTCEEIAGWLAKKLENVLPFGIWLKQLKLQEGEGGYARIGG